MDSKLCDFEPASALAGGHFSGTVRVGPCLRRSVRFARQCTFEPGARTAWHSHPHGHVLIVASGRGFVQRRGGPVENVGAGDVVCFPPGEMHRHGAAADSGMTQIVTGEHLCAGVEWAGAGLPGIGRAETGGDGDRAA